MKTKTFNLHAKLIQLDFKTIQHGKIIQLVFVNIIRPDIDECVWNYFYKCKFNKLICLGSPLMSHLYVDDESSCHDIQTSTTV